MIISDIIAFLRFKPEPESPTEYWNPAELSEDEHRKLCSLSFDEKGNAYGYNPAKMANPAWKGNAKSRIGFTFDPYYHPLGKFLQGTIKGSLMKCVNFVHSGILRYDSNAYQYEDTRLIELHNVISESIEELFYDELEARSWNDGRRKIELLKKSCDIALFLMKEDIAYRWRFMLLMQRVGRAVEHFEPTPEEKANLKALRK